MAVTAVSAAMEVKREEDEEDEDEDCCDEREKVETYAVDEAEVERREAVAADC